MKIHIYTLLCVVLHFGAVSALEERETRAVPEGFTSVFDGETLAGWDGDPRFWSVSDGCITGHSTPENVVPHNSFLILRKFGEVKNFTLVMDFKMSRQSNSGISFRATETEGKPWNILGYHADVFDARNHMATLYRNGVMAWRGQSVAVAPDRKITVSEQFGNPDELLGKIDMYGWNTLRLEVAGNHYTLWINGEKMAEVQEDPAITPSAGVLGFQMHQGPPMTIQFKNVFFREGGE